MPSLDVSTESPEIPLPNEQGRVEVLKIHAQKLNKEGDIDYESIAKIAEEFNAADMRNVCKLRAKEARDCADEPHAG